MLKTTNLHSVTTDLKTVRMTDREIKGTCVCLIWKCFKNKTFHLKIDLPSLSDWHVGNLTVAGCLTFLTVIQMFRHRPRKSVCHTTIKAKVVLCELVFREEENETEGYSTGVIYAHEDGHTAHDIGPLPLQLVRLSQMTVHTRIQQTYQRWTNHGKRFQSNSSQDGSLTCSHCVCVPAAVPQQGGTHQADEKMLLMTSGGKRVTLRCTCNRLSTSAKTTPTVKSTAARISRFTVRLVIMLT